MKSEKIVIKSNSLEETQQIAIEFSKKLKSGDIVIFNGDLGVGKTEFVKAICTQWAVEQTISSPSFSIINQYETFCNNAIRTIFHIDLYRIKNQKELIDIGFQELIYNSDAIFFIEWEENSFGIINKFDYRITIKICDENETSRIIEMEANECTQSAC